MAGGGKKALEGTTLGALGVGKGHQIEVRYRLRGGMGCASSKPLDSSEVQFEYLTPMLVMPFAQFKRQGRIMKSVAKWRGEALREGWLVEYDKDSRKIVIFVSHT